MSGNFARFNRNSLTQKMPEVFFATCRQQAIIAKSVGKTSFTPPPEKSYPSSNSIYLFFFTFFYLFTKVATAPGTLRDPIEGGKMLLDCWQV
jgi:hypothetical protein